MYDYLKLQPDNQIVMEEKLASEKTTEEHMAEYLESMKALEEAMEPYKEQKRELKAEYIDEGWLTRDDISLAVKAYRLAKSDTDMSQLIDMVESLKQKGVGQ
jgi:anti-sigma factor RsiW